MRLLVGVSLAALLLVPIVARADAGPLSPQHRMLGRGVKLVVDGKYAEAEPLLKRALTMDPTLPEGHYNLAVVYKYTGRPADAVTEYRIALGEFSGNDIPDLTKCLYGIALVQEDRGDPAQAAQAWNEYIQFAQRYAPEQPAVAIARRHEQQQLQAARLKAPSPFGPARATRPTHRE